MRRTKRQRGPAPLVLVIDDNADTRDIYETYLTYVGFRVATAVNGKVGIEAARALKPSLIVMDLTMPVFDGWSAIRFLKADSELRVVPIIAVSGHAMKGADRLAMEAGCDRYMTKPCLPQDLVAAIRELLGRRPEGRRSAHG